MRRRPSGITCITWLGTACAALALLGTTAGRAKASDDERTLPAAPAPPARFAIIVGVNQSVDKSAAPLRYADDDAARFLDLFRTLGARTYLLSRFDENTQRLHPQAAAEAHDPRLSAFTQVIGQVAADVAKARARLVPTVLYFVYAGHGNVEDGRGYLALEDARLFGADLERLVLDEVKAGEAHVIVDACYSVFLALGRGPGGQRETIHGFSTLGGLGARRDVGLLLSTSSARESHEWSEFQAGIFSHEVRSGLLGAADANRDGRITYREIAAFVDRANAPIPNEKFRPDVYVKEPAASEALVDLRPGLRHRLELDGAHAGHYRLEDARGVRLADFHNAPGQPLHLVREASGGPLYLRRTDLGEDQEYLLDGAADVLALADLHPSASTAQARGAAHESFSLLFTLPFSQGVVDDYVVARLALASERADAAQSLSLRRPIGLGLVGVGVAAGIGGTWAVLSAVSLQHDPVANQAQAYAINQDIERRNTWARALYVTGGAALATGALLLLWPQLGGSAAPSVALQVEPQGFGVQGRF